MLSKKSRYQHTSHFTDTDVFPGLQTRSIGDATGVVEHEVAQGDRLDQLAQHYYKDCRLWWRIIDANPDVTFPRALLSEDMVGQVILIPRARE